jgi:hypothetical protein
MISTLANLANMIRKSFQELLITDNFLFISREDNGYDEDYNVLVVIAMVSIT